MTGIEVVTFILVRIDSFSNDIAVEVRAAYDEYFSWLDRFKINFQLETLYFPFGGFRNLKSIQENGQMYDSNVLEQDVYASVMIRSFRRSQEQLTVYLQS